MVSETGWEELHSECYARTYALYLNKNNNSIQVCVAFIVLYKHAGNYTINLCVSTKKL